MTTRGIQISAAALAATLLWSGSYVSGKLALDGFSPMSLLGLRFLLGAPLMFMLTSSSSRQAMMKRSRALLILIIAGLINSSNQVLWIHGLDHTTASHSVLLFALSPIWAAMIAIALGRDRFRLNVLIGGGVAFLGVVLIVFRGLDLTASTLFGDLITLVATFFYAASVVLVGMVVGAYGPIAVAATAATLGGLTTLPFTAVALGATEWGAISTVSWIAIIYSIFGAFVLAQIFWFKGISQIGSTQTIIYNYLQPVFGVLLAALILGERLDLTQIVGAVVVLAGVSAAQGRFDGLPRRLAVRLR